MNARFWVWWNDGWAKLTVAPGQAVTLASGGQTDEGWERSVVTYENDGVLVESVVFSEGRDCDGYTSRLWEGGCAIADLHGGEGHDGTPIPLWEKSKVVCHDEYAELAGY